MHPFEIELNGLRGGKTAFQAGCDRSLFEWFGCTDILDADLAAEVEIDKSGSFIGVQARINGTVTVPCDRCCDDLELPVSTGFTLSVKFAEEDGREEMEDGTELVTVPYDATVLDLRQFVYDYVITSLPMRRVHKEGGCNPESEKYLN